MNPGQTDNGSYPPRPSFPPQFSSNGSPSIEHGSDPFTNMQMNRPPMPGNLQSHPGMPSQPPMQGGPGYPPQPPSFGAFPGPFLPPQPIRPMYPPPPVGANLPPAPFAPFLPPPFVPMKAMRRPKADPPKEPNNTLYVRNIHEKRNPKAVTQQLTLLFSKYGKVLQVICRKGIKGQAFVVLETIEMAEKALKEMQGHVFHNRPMDVQFARHLSFSTAEKEGKLEEVKSEREIRQAKKMEEMATKKQMTKKEDHTLPNAILFLENLSADYRKEALEQLFGGYPGFVEVRIVPSRSDIAFVEYSNEQFSTVVKQALHGYRLGGDLEMKVSFAKR